MNALKIEQGHFVASDGRIWYKIELRTVHDMKLLYLIKNL